MTKADKPTTRLSYSTIRSGGKSREIVVTIHPTWIALRLKKTKQVFQLDIASAFQHAALLKTNKDRAEKKAAKIAKKKGSSK